MPYQDSDTVTGISYAIVGFEIVPLVSTTYSTEKFLRIHNYSFKKCA